ncbi:exported hypothetical protein [uncultured Pleomorphomonas sp.]|uniref:Uncharacterized protein n=1 Tax=uncultured Pleomorphomonas sp. TaxID=442121 RepID=A0A212LJC0_9HYPH|nr:exported hypothetical protein [uncultured Pleomorphomonas sp.]
MPPSTPVQSFSMAKRLPSRRSSSPRPSSPVTMSVTTRAGTPSKAPGQQQTGNEPAMKVAPISHRDDPTRPLTDAFRAPGGFVRRTGCRLPGSLPSSHVARTLRERAASPLSSLYISHQGKRHADRPAIETPQARL